MSDLEYYTTRQRELEAFCMTQFSASLEVRKLLFDELTLQDDALMAVFSTADNRIFAAIETDTSLRLGDVERLIKEAGFKPLRYMAPQGRRSYFLQRAFNIFKEVYPARTQWTPDQEYYYQLLVPYSPALVQLGGITGAVRQYNTFGKVWQTVYEPSRRLRFVRG